MKIITYLTWTLQLVAAIILLQTLYFKFTAAPESVYIFSKLHAEPYGRIGSGIVELIAAVLLLTPRYSWLGALLAMGVMAGAIFSHLTVLGIDVMGDKGELFILAWVVFISSAIVLFLRRAQIPFVSQYI
jgi:uncharacterized membrane protein YphA (DoxX/SURF4 family)